MGELKLIKLADIQARNVEWLWELYLPKGKVSILRGHPGEGKSMFIMALISALSTGDPLFNEEDRREPVACVYQSAEDALDDTIKPRLDAAFADCERVFTIDERNDPLSFTDSRIEQAIRDTSAGLMILDPLQAYLGANVDMYRANEVRPVLTGLVDVSARTGCAILLVEHMNKMKGASAITKGLGSMDITGAATITLRRYTWLMSKATWRPGDRPLSSSPKTTACTSWAPATSAQTSCWTARTRRNTGRPRAIR